MGSLEYVLKNYNYGKFGVKCLHLVKNGKKHAIKELEISIRLTLGTQKDFIHGDNSDIIDSDSTKNMVYVLAKKHGIKSPEDFGTLIANEIIKQYENVVKVSVRIEEMLWNRVNFDDHSSHELHNHAFVHSPLCARNARVVLERNEKYPAISSGIKDLRVIKTSKSSFANFSKKDAYRTNPDFPDRILSTIVDCSWNYYPNLQIDYNKTWDQIKRLILKNFAGDLEDGVQSTSTQNTLYTTEKNILENIQEVSSIKATYPNKHYVSYDFSKLKQIVSDDKETVFIPLDKPSGVVFAELGRQHPQSL